MGPGLLVLLALTLGVAALGSVFTAAGQPEWYGSLAKPAFTPPSWVFGPVWTTLYVLMAVAAWLVWERAGSDRGRAALTAFGIQLLLNLAWSGVFFALRAPGWALLVLAALWVAIAVTMRLFLRHSRPAAWLLAPYLAWVSYAAALNFAIWRLN